jgi:hypothetical protein
LAQAEAKFKKKAADADSAAAEIRAERLAVQDKIARLRALRLAKEAADKAAGVRAATEAAPGLKPTRAKHPGGRKPAARKPNPES